MSNERRLVYLIGEPGVGKTKLMTELMRRLGHEPRRQPNSWRLMRYSGLAEGRVWALGDYSPRRGPFGGTDGLSMAVMPDAVEFLRVAFAHGAKGRPAHLVGEGDRLATVGFFQAATEAGWEVHLFMLTASTATCEARRRSRAALAGAKEQDAAWLAGRRTKVANLFRAATVEFPATMHPAPLETEQEFGTALAQLEKTLQ